MKKSISLFLTFFMLTNYSYANDQPSSQSEDKPIYSGTSSPTKDRLWDEYSTQFDENVMTPHKMNYFLPVSYTDGINRGAYQDLGDDFTEGLEDIEIKIQLSLKVPLNYDSMFIEGDSLYFSFTIASWWQAYASEISEPFRETNYQPELFYIAPTQWHPNDANVAWLVGFEHQSNGRSGSFSRSWNRAYIGGIYEKDNYSF
jgi:phospholipase A1